MVPLVLSLRDCGHIHSRVGGGGRDVLYREGEKRGTGRNEQGYGFYDLRQWSDFMKQYLQTPKK